MGRSVGIVSTQETQKELATSLLATAASIRPDELTGSVPWSRWRRVLFHAPVFKGVLRASHFTRAEGVGVKNLPRETFRGDIAIIDSFDELLPSIPGTREDLLQALVELRTLAAEHDCLVVVTVGGDFCLAAGDAGKHSEIARLDVPADVYFSLQRPDVFDSCSSLSGEVEVTILKSHSQVVPQKVTLSHQLPYRRLVDQELSGTLDTSQYIAEPLVVPAEDGVEPGFSTRSPWASDDDYHVEVMIRFERTNSDELAGLIEQEIQRAFTDERMTTLEQLGLLPVLHEHGIWRVSELGGLTARVRTISCDEPDTRGLDLRSGDAQDWGFTSGAVVEVQLGDGESCINVILNGSVQGAVDYVGSINSLDISDMLLPGSALT